MKPGHQATLAHGSSGTGHPGSPIQGPWSVAHVPLAGQHTSGMWGEPGVLAPRPCSTTQCCQGTSVGTTAGLVSKLPRQLGEPALRAECTGSPSKHRLHHAGSSASSAALWECWPSGRRGAQPAPANGRHDAIPYLSGGKGGGKLHPPGSGAPVLVKANFDAEGSLYICHYYSCHCQAKHSELTLWRRDRGGCFKEEE